MERGIVSPRWDSLRRVRKLILIAVVAALALAALGSAACGDDESNGDSNRGLPQGSEPAELDAADFTTDIDNPYWPMQAGNRWVYRETDTEGTEERVVVTATAKTKRIANG